MVTGGAGFIGSHIAERLENDGYKVIVVDNFSTGKRENLKNFSGIIIESNISAPDAMLEIMKKYKIEYICHQAAIPSVKKSVEAPYPNMMNNINSTMTLYEAARKYGKIKKIVAASSSSVYGESLKLPKEESDPVNPISPYALSKYFTENLTVIYDKLYGIPSVALRYFNVFGPRQDPGSPYSAVIAKFISNTLKGRTIEIYGDGEQTRDFTYIENVVSANLLSLFSEASGVFNIACGSRISLNALVELIFRVTGAEVALKNKEERKGDIKHSLSSVEKAKTELKYEPSVSVEEGIRRTVDFYKNA